LTKNKKRPVNTAQIDNNIILSYDVIMSLNDYFTKRNLNVMIDGGPGTGKSRGYVIPNLLNANTSFVVTDPKGELLRSCGTFLKRLGYKIKVFNLDDMQHSSNYNPFNYVYDSEGKLDYNAVKKMINVLMKNVAGGSEKNKSSDPFWDTSAEKLIIAITILLLEEGSKSQQNFSTVAEKMRNIEFPADPKDTDFKSKLDKEFDILEEKNPNSLGVLLYREFKQGAGKTMKSVISVANSKLQDFNLPNVKHLTHCDNLGLGNIGDEKTALFILIPASDTTFNFLAAIMYTQMFDILYERALSLPTKRLPVHVRFLLDEFATVGQIPDFDNLITTMRSMGISANVILQSVSQLKKLYENSWETIIAGCDSFLFLGGQDETSLKFVSEKLGKETIDIVSRGRTRSYRQNSTNENNALHGRELLTPDELAKLNNDYCVLIVRGYNPFYSKKYVMENHPNYMYTAMYDESFAYDLRSVKTVIMPILTPTEKENKKKELHFEVADEGLVNETVRGEILKMKTTETNVFGGLNMMFDTTIPRLTEIIPATIGGAFINEGGGNTNAISTMGSVLYDINVPDNGKFSFSDEKTAKAENDYYDIKERSK
jgi:type IV secretion system protein VirD4